MWVVAEPVKKQQVDAVLRRIGPDRQRSPQGVTTGGADRILLAAEHVDLPLRVHQVAPVIQGQRDRDGVDGELLGTRACGTDAGWPTRTGCRGVGARRGWVEVRGGPVVRCEGGSLPQMRLEQGIGELAAAGIEEDRGPD